MENLDLIKKVHETGMPQGDARGFKHIDGALIALKDLCIGDNGAYRLVTDEEANKYSFIHRLCEGMGYSFDNPDEPITVEDVEDSYGLNLEKYYVVNRMLTPYKYVLEQLFGPTFVLHPTIYHDENDICIGYKYIIGYTPNYSITDVVEINTLYNVVIYDDKTYAPIPKDFESYEGVQFIWDMFEDIFNFPDIGEPIDECMDNGNSSYINFELESL